MLISYWSQLFCLGEYETKNEDLRISFVISMPSESFELKWDHEIKVINSGLELEVSVVCPPRMSDMLYLY